MIGAGLLAKKAVEFGLKTKPWVKTSLAPGSQVVTDYLAKAGLAVLVLNLAMMTLAFYIAKFFATGISQRKCITLECGLQNGTLAIVVATTIFGGGIYLIPAATYSLIMFGTSLIYVYIVRSSN